jgi:putative (di)nucleoside polyphosphate hydrolase
MYRKGVGLVLVNNLGQVFVAKRVQNASNNNLLQNPWQMPQGGIDENEDEQESLFREMHEEIGLKQNDVRVMKKSETYYRYDLPEDVRAKLWSGKYKGQEQRWFCCFLQGSESNINLDGEHPEFSSWKWISPYSLSSIVVDFKKDMYDKIFEEFYPTIKLCKNL